MNDFTKEELYFLSEMISKYQHADLTRLCKITNKIKSMIDNYCEHGRMAVHQSKCPDCGEKVE